MIIGENRVRTRSIVVSAATAALTTGIVGLLAARGVPGAALRTEPLRVSGSGASFEDADTAGFSMLAVSWNEPGHALDGEIRVRTKSVATGAWSPWTVLGTERGEGVRGVSEPLWAGPSDGVEVKVAGHGGALPAGLRLDLVDPGADPAGAGPGAGDDTVPAAFGAAPAVPAARSAAARPDIVSRSAWGAREQPGDDPVYGKEVKAVFVHHTAQTNAYDCTDSAALLRGLQELHVRTNGWKDLGYNFVVDKCGTVFEGRRGGADRPVTGAHTLGFNTDTMGIAVIGEYSSQEPSGAAMNAVARLAGWKLGRYGYDPQGSVTLTSGLDNGTFRTGQGARFERISGHRDAFSTECPGTLLYRRLPDIRSRAADPLGGSLTGPLTDPLGGSLDGLVGSLAGQRG
ncbi:peptidoglycan recognition protein [Streptomyces sp. G-G2]|uniref:peptidoglycan recognition protein family protein n=1 Tax=Streptomyces sp. G-G2 TaxID=3046201 RepID=UPI0024BB1670|nr:peptidoglycan recognition protein [Streptomyces sp. G-G2]MDJ0383914.1 peptidoglycan recognition protein [Streptomyces sp. G-G2]